MKNYAGEEEICTGFPQERFVVERELSHEKLSFNEDFDATYGGIKMKKPQDMAYKETNASGTLDLVSRRTASWPESQQALV